MKRNIDMSQITTATSTTTQTRPTPEMRAYLDANPGWADEPFTNLFRAGFNIEDFAQFAYLAKAQHRDAQTSPVRDRVQEWLSAHEGDQRLEVQAILDADFSKEERAILVPAQKAAVAANEANRLTARTLIIPATAVKEWKDPEFYVVATAGDARHASGVSPTDPDRRQLHTVPIDGGDHPVRSAKIGDTWNVTNEGGEFWEFEFIGKFRLVGTFKDADTGWKNHIVREVTA
jgi:hypothetical protein